MTVPCLNRGLEPTCYGVSDAFYRSPSYARDALQAPMITIAPFTHISLPYETTGRSNRNIHRAFDQLDTTQVLKKMAVKFS